MADAPDCRPGLEAMLKEAQAAYHQLMLGGGVRVVVDQNGERVEYTAGNKQYLFNWILRLQAQLASSNPCDPNWGAPKGPAGFLFP